MSVVPRLRLTRASKFIATGLLLAVSLGLSGQVSAGTRSIDIRDERTFRARGALSVGAAGDVNGDGVGDILLLNCGVGVAGGAELIFVVFGPVDPGEMDLNDPAQLEAAGRGFRIVGADPYHQACNAAGAGDVNGDGLADLVVGAPYAGEVHRHAAGQAYLIFGKPTTESVSLAAFNQGLQGNQGFRMDGAGYRDLAGRTVAGLGDVNGDGRSDIAVGAPFADSVYVVFGKSDPAPIDFMTFHLGTSVGGFRIRTPPVGVDYLLEVGGGGDVNDDGLADVVVGYSEPEEGYPLCAAFVVLGKNDPLSVDTRRLGSSGFEIRGPSRYSGAGRSVAIVGDVNRDGLDDIAVGVPSARRYRKIDGESTLTNQGAVFVVFGKKSTGTVYLANVGDRGYEIRAPRIEVLYSSVGDGVAAGGDIDGDGRHDVLVGAGAASYNGREAAGSVYVVFGSGSTRTVKLGSLAQRGYRIDGPRRHGFNGFSVAGPGDVIGNSRPDILIGGSASYPVSFVVAGRR